MGEQITHVTARRDRSLGGLQRERLKTDRRAVVRQLPLGSRHDDLFAPDLDRRVPAEAYRTAGHGLGAGQRRRCWANCDAYVSGIVVPVNGEVVQVERRDREPRQGAVGGRPRVDDRREVGGGIRGYAHRQPRVDQLDGLDRQLVPQGGPRQIDAGFLSREERLIRVVANREGETSKPDVQPAQVEVDPLGMADDPEPGLECPEGPAHQPGLRRRDREEDRDAHDSQEQQDDDDRKALRARSKSHFGHSSVSGGDPPALPGRHPEFDSSWSGMRNSQS